jgi:nitric oxide reductase NorD protein
MGVALRHSEKRLLDFPARKRAILLLTDAKPTDFDRYEGSHGRGDVRKAIDQLDASDIRLLSLVLSSKQERAFVDLFGKNRSHVVKSAQDIGREFTTQFISLME